MAISYTKFKRTFGDLGITEWVKFNWLSNAGIGRNIYNKVVESGYNPLAYVNDKLYNRITKSINIWDEEWTINTSNNLIGTTFNDILPNTEYYVKCPTNAELKIQLYDINKSAINYYWRHNNTFTTPSNAYFFKIADSSNYGSTYNHDICINESNPFINGNYFPYFEDEKFLVMVGRVDLGTLDWTINNPFVSLSVFRSDDLLNLVKPTSAEAIAKILCANYTPETRVNVVTGNYNKTISVGGLGVVGSFLNICDNSYTNANTFKQAMSGVMLNYELATPILIDL